MIMMQMLLVSIIGKLKVCRVGGSSSIGSGRKGSLRMMRTMRMMMTVKMVVMRRMRMEIMMIIMVIPE